MQILNERFYSLSNKYLFPLIFRGTDKKEDQFYKVNNSIEFKVRGGFDKFIIYEIWKLKEYVDKNLPINKSDIIVDLGAHIGAFSIWAAKQAKNGKIFAYEPLIDNFDLLKFNKIHNNINNLQIYNKAVSLKGGIIDIFISKENSGAHSIVEVGSEKKLNVPSISFEQIFTENNIKKIDYLKLDIEGAEYEILLNSSSEIFNKIDHIILEYHDYLRTNHDHKEIIAVLKNSGYKVKISGFKLQRMLFNSGIIKAYK